jgi:hypothetical protein
MSKRIAPYFWEVKTLDLLETFPELTILEQETNSDKQTRRSRDTNHYS